MTESISNPDYEAWLNHPMAKFFGCNEPIKVTIEGKRDNPIYGSEQGHLGINDLGWNDTEYLVKAENGMSIWVDRKYVTIIARVVHIAGDEE